MSVEGTTWGVVYANVDTTDSCYVGGSVSVECVIAGVVHVNVDCYSTL